VREIRNSDGYLIAKFDETTDTIIIVRRGCETRLRFCKDGTIEIVNTKSTKLEVA